MSDEIKIPIEDLLPIIYDDTIKVVQKMTEAYEEYGKAYSILGGENGTNNYKGNANELLETANGSMVENLGKLLEFYNVCLVYIDSVIRQYLEADNEIAQKIYENISRMYGNGGQ